MRTHVLLAALVGAALQVGAAGALELGAAMPSRDVKMKNVNGQTLSLAGAGGEKGTLVVFSCNHCPYVKAWEERITALGNEYLRKGIGVVAVNSNDAAEYPDDDLPAMQARARERGFEFPYVVDATSNVARAFGATKTPEAFLFDAAGRLVYHGTIDDNAQDPAKVGKRYLRDALEDLLAGREVAVKETKALGCSIKFRPAA
ncbi:MAG: thioredoxin family protein [Acidobacteriota bacterium]